MLYINRFQCPQTGFCLVAGLCSHPCGNGEHISERGGVKQGKQRRRRSWSFSALACPVCLLSLQAHRAVHPRQLHHSPGLAGGLAHSQRFFRAARP